jgi:thiamine-monophosphate kinase
MMAAGEFEYIRWLRGRTPTHPRVLVGPGDDCAVLARPTGSVLVTTDVLTEGVDFRLAETDPRAIGRKAMAVNLSDIAAMAGVPTAAVVGVVLPVGGGRQLAEELFHGLREVADAFGVALVGGDTNTWDGGLVISVTILGEATSRGAVRRSGAKPGDWVFVSGPLGGSILGRHLSPTPRVREALALHEFADLHAMADISDGLAADLNHILEESGCGAVLDAAAIPVHPDAVDLSGWTDGTPLAHALGDGEDFELVFTVSPIDGERLLRELPVPGLAKVGECVESGLWLVENGTRRPLEPRGWVHRVGAARGLAAGG